MSLRMKRYWAERRGEPLPTALPSEEFEAQTLVG